MTDRQTVRHTEKFGRRRAEILDVASIQINEVGARGMTLTAVARALGIDTSSVTYYFRRKEMLAAACLARTLEWLRDRAVEAAALPTPAARARRFLHANIDLHRRQRTESAPQLALLSDMRSLEGEPRAALDAIYAEMFYIVRDYFAPLGRRPSLLACVTLINIVHWIPAWIDEYQTGDLPRVEERLFDLLASGLARGTWRVDGVPPAEVEHDDAQARFLHAATNLINRHGYHGASVERIAAELGVSTGSFYHHLENKNELVIACFQRSFTLLDRAQAIGDEGGGSRGEQLARMLASILALQLGGDSPLLRTGAYQALPMDLRQQMLRRTAQVTRHVAGTVADGIADESLRAVDPVLAGHLVLSVINAAADLRRWAARRPIETAVADMMEIVRVGIF